jgi:hypothetical protein
MSEVIDVECFICIQAHGSDSDRQRTLALQQSLAEVVKSSPCELIKR